MRAKEFLDLIKPKILPYENSNEDFSNIEPSKQDFEKVQKIGHWNHEYYPGGFLSNSSIIYNYSDEKKLISFLNKIKSRKDIVKYAKAIIAVLGYYSTRNEVLQKCYELHCTEKEIDSIKNYKKTAAVRIETSF